MSRVLITGASKGIGRSIATELLARGHDVIATARNPETLADLPVSLALPLDVTSQESIDEAIDAAGPIDVMISNAGEIIVASVEDSPIAEIERLFAVNTVGAVRVTQAVVPQMRARGTGRLIYMSSAVASVALPLIGAYAATKHALDTFAETLALELRHFKISVNLIEPGAVDSGALDDPPTYTGGGHYTPLAAQLSLSADMIAAHSVARATADVIDNADDRLRIPVGDAAEFMAMAGRDWPRTSPFEPAPLDW